MESGVIDPEFCMKNIQVSGPIVLTALTQACSQNASVLKPAEQKLHSWETQPGFYTVLQVSQRNKLELSCECCGTTYDDESEPSLEWHILTSCGETIG